MSNTETRGLFGPARIRPGTADTEWAVWYSGSPTELAQPDQQTALACAAEANASFADTHDENPFVPPVWAVVLHWGYAWKRGTDTTAGPISCTCGDTAGPFVPGTGLCEGCTPAGGGA